MSPNPLDTLEEDWQRELHRPLLHSRFRARQEAEPALSRFADLKALVRFMHRAAGAGAKKDRVLCALLVWAQQDPLGGRVVLEAIRPGLLRLAGRMIGRRGATMRSFGRCCSARRGSGFAAIPSRAARAGSRRTCCWTR